VTNSRSALDTALELLRRGLWPVVLYPAGAMIQTRDGPKVATGKQPLGQAWGKTRPTEADLRRLFRAHPGAGVGILLGPAGGVVDLEVDGPEGADSLVKLFGGEEVETLGWSSRRGPHKLFLWDDWLAAIDPHRRAKLTLPELPGLEFRFGQERQAQSACPPTVGEDGGRRVWNGCDTIAPLPEAALRYLAEALATPRADAGDGRPGDTTDSPTSDPAGAWFRRALGTEAGRVATAREGDRHKALFAASRTLGGMLHHGYLTEAEVIRELAHAGSRAGLPEQEVRETIRDGLAYGKDAPLPWPDKLERPYKATRDGRADATPRDGPHVEPGGDDSEPIETPPWPKPPPPVAFHGPLGAFVNAIAPHSEADPFGVLLQALVMFGNAVGRGPYYQVESTRHYPNEFLIEVGDSATGRKGTGTDRVLALFHAADPGWKANNIRGGLSSGEGLIAAVRDPSHQKQPIKEKGRVVGYQEVEVDGGVEDKRCMVIETEFGRTLRVMARESNTLSAVIRQAFDSGDLAVLTKNAARATGAHISVIGHITSRELRALLSGVDVANGFANRFLWACVRRARELPFGGSEVDLSGHAARIAASLDFARAVGRVVMTAAARVVWEGEYGRLTTPGPGALGDVLSRGAPHAVRLAMLYALGDRSGVITDDHLNAALEVWDACARSAAHIFGGGTGDREADRILEALRDAPGGMTRTQIRRNVFQDHHPSDRIKTALQTLLSCGLIRQETDRETGGAPAVRFFAVTPREKREKRDNPRPGGASHANHAFHAHAADGAAGQTKADGREVFEL
jgi:hypothetical protein